MAQNNTFLGTGWSFPPAFFNQGEQVELVSEEEDIRQSLQIMLTTKLGERIMHADYGCNMNRYLFEDIDKGLATKLQNLIADAIRNHEGRIETDRVEVTENPDETGLIMISVRYTIRSTNNRYNLVFPYYINEANSPGYLLTE